MGVYLKLLTLAACAGRTASFQSVLHPLAATAAPQNAQRPLFSRTALDMSSDDGLGAARAMLFDDQHRAMGQRSETEGDLLDPNMRELRPPAKNRKKKQKGARGGVGFGGGAAKLPKLTKLEESTANFASIVQEDGVVLLPGVLKRETAETLRSCIYGEIEHMREEVRASPGKSVSYFYVPAEIHFSTPRGYVLLPFRDTESVVKGPNDVGSIVDAAREMLAEKQPLAELFSTLLDGSNSRLYDFCALRTEPGAGRQQVHYDTPYQETPGLFCAFVALQDVTFEMGGTLFIPGTHKQTDERKSFDDGAQDGRRDAMLQKAKSRYTMLKAGDAAVFDMRCLHCGLPNLPAEEGGSNRLLLAITFRNLDARQDLGHKPNLRPGYIDTHTLGTFQRELANKAPFVQAGDGLVLA